MTGTSPDWSPDAQLWGLSAKISRDGLLASIYSTFAVATVFLCLRLILRWRYNGRLLLGDYWMLFAYLAFVTQTVLQTVQLDAMWYVIYLDFGRISPTDPDRYRQAREMARWYFAVTGLFWTVLWSVKASLLVTFYKLVRPITRLRRCLYAVAGFTVLSYVGCWVVYTCLRASPENMYLLETRSAGRRARISAIFVTVVDTLSDILIALLPMYILPSLQLSRGKKFGIGLTFALGLLVVAVAIVRMTQITCGYGIDYIGVALWGAVETATSIVVGSLLSLGGLLTKGVRGLRRGTGYSKQSGSAGGKSSYYSGGLSSSARTRGSTGLASTSDSDNELVQSQRRESVCVLEVQKTVETDVYSEYAHDADGHDGLAEMRKKELQLA
ncbi:uncharacterized protein F5Z01DRAFT_428136 [Emericellopsis atlantica]|uniref:Rhodopsin domain-containing protein n=1 Tax=Emericellopsis atlantica TaxID=2614577 RepID=A0A9P7ZDN8_9HYPO|nr:uncharacterized protein F5Z01DRAFT_428136 [Emericellopsis atlantica]KAG9250105.1 hypothetical protein F5Z01DRAFT_428136 [Emericellopsis atlantica]